MLYQCGFVRDHFIEKGGLNSGNKKVKIFKQYFMEVPSF